jgi:hypothetical protein
VTNDPSRRNGPPSFQPTRAMDVIAALGRLGRAVGETKSLGALPAESSIEALMASSP